MTRGAAREPAGPLPAVDPLLRDVLHDLLRALLRVTPHAAAEGRAAGVLVWADARGLPPRVVAADALRLTADALARAGRPADGVRAGVARVAVAAEVAARRGARGARREDRVSRAPGPATRDAAPDSRIVVVPPGRERAFLAPYPLAALADTPAWSPRLAAALEGVGVETCGDLAALTREAVEVRFGAEGAALWRLARADDTRAVFAPARRDLPSASAEWLEFALRDAGRLVFFANGLVGRVCDDLRGRGQAARAMTLRLALAGGGGVERAVRAARPSADRAAWLRLVRAALAREDLPDAVSGIALRVDAADAGDAPQGDLFDGGFQTAAAAEGAVARLVEDGDAAPVRLRAGGDALPERRARWEAAEPGRVAEALRRPPGASPPGAPIPNGTAPRPEPLALRLLDEPVPVAVVSRARRGHQVPVRYRERPPAPARRGPGGGPSGRPLVEVVAAAGPDRVSVAHEGDAAAAREYWQCATDDGRIVLLFRDASAPAGGGAGGAWYLHGWWD